MVTIYALLHTSNWIDCHFIWGGIHFSINAYFLLKYAKTHWTAKFTEELKELMADDREFGMFDRVEMVALTTKCGFQWMDVQQGDYVLTHGQPVERLLFATKGKIKIMNGEGGFIARFDIAKIGCQWLGEMAYYTSDPASASLVVESEDGARFMSWDMKSMRHMSHSHSHSVESVVFRQLPSLFAAQLAGRTARLSNDLAKGREDSARMAKALSNTKVIPSSQLKKRSKSQLKKKSTMKKRLEDQGSSGNAELLRAMNVLHQVEEMSMANKNKWKKAKRKSFAQKLSSDDRKDQNIREGVAVLFDFYDVQGNGHIDEHYLGTMITNIITRAGVSNETFPKEEITVIMKSLDADGNGTVEKTELIDWVSKGLKRSTELRKKFSEKSSENKRLENFLIGCEIFANRLKGVDEVMLQEGVEKLYNFYDIDGNGAIDMKELGNMLQNTLSRSGVSMDIFPKDDIQLVMNSLDDNGNGTVEKEELVTWVMKGLKRSTNEREETRLRGGFETRLDDFLSACRIFASKLKNLEFEEEKKEEDGGEGEEGEEDTGAVLFLEKKS